MDWSRCPPQVPHHTLPFAAATRHAPFSSWPPLCCSPPAAKSAPATPEAALESPAATAVSPTPAPADPALGRELQRNGEYEEAIAVYEQVITRSPEPERLPARLSLARTYLLSGRNLEARRELEVFLSQAASDSDRRLGRFLLAEALEGLGDKEEALDLYYQFAQEGSPAAPYANLARARLLASLGRTQEAVAAADLALSAGLPPIVTAGALLDIARGFESAGALDDAILWYERLFKESESSADQALARWRVGVLSRLRGDPNWAENHLAVILDYPSAPAALEALADLQEAGVSVDGYLAGLVYYRHNEDGEAQEAFQAYLQQDPPGPHDAEAAYYLAAVYERGGDEEAALDAYDDSLRRDPDGPLADAAAWWRARLLEDLARYESAISAYRAFPRQYPDSPWASEAVFRSGLLLYKEEKYDEAVSAFDEARYLTRDSDDVDRARLWLAKAHMAGGQAGEAMTILNELAKEDPSNYYSLRAAALLGEPLPSAEAGEVDLTKASSIDWAAIDAWAASWLPSAPSTSPQAFLSDPRWARASELVDLQLFDEASGEFESLLDAYGTTSPALYSLTRALYPLGLTHLSARAASRLLAALPQPAIDAAPPTCFAWPIPLTTALSSSPPPSEPIPRPSSWRPSYDRRASSTPGRARRPAPSASPRSSLPPPRRSPPALASRGTSQTRTSSDPPSASSSAPSISLSNWRPSTGAWHRRWPPTTAAPATPVAGSRPPQRTKTSSSKRSPLIRHEPTSRWSQRIWLPTRLSTAAR